MDNTRGMKNKSAPSPPNTKCSSLSLLFPRNDFDSCAWSYKESGGQPQLWGLSTEAVSNDSLMSDDTNSHDINIIEVCDNNACSSLGNIVDDICGKECYDSSSNSSHNAISSLDSGDGRNGSTIGKTSIPASGSAHADASFSSTANTGQNNRTAGISNSCDNLSSLELEMTYDPHGCIYGPEGRLTPDSSWKKHLEFLACVPEYY